VADDDADLRDLVSFTLAQAGYLVIKAADGTTAVQPLLMIMLLAALIVLQLRRRQKSLRSPRLLA
jgi:DNA-binding response OmpR family regulator